MAITKFKGYLKFHPIYSKCAPIVTYGHWELKESERVKGRKVWCDTREEGLYHTCPINAEFAEIYKIEK